MAGKFAGWSSKQEGAHSIFVGDHASPLAPLPQWQGWEGSIVSGLTLLGRAEFMSLFLSFFA